MPLRVCLSGRKAARLLSRLRSDERERERERVRERQGERMRTNITTSQRQKHSLPVSKRRGGRRERPFRGAGIKSASETRTFRDVLVPRERERESSVYQENHATGTYMGFLAKWVELPNEA